MTGDQLKQLLNGTRFGDGFSPELLEHVAGHARPGEYPAGTVLFREGEVVHELHIVTAGRVALEMRVPGRGSVRLLTVGRDELLAWSAFLHGGRMTATAIVLEPTQTVILDAKRLREACEQNHELGYRVLWQLAQGLSERLVNTRLQFLDLFAAPGTAVNPPPATVPPEGV